MVNIHILKKRVKFANRMIKEIREDKNICVNYLELGKKNNLNKIFDLKYKRKPDKRLFKNKKKVNKYGTSI